MSDKTNKSTLEKSSLLDKDSFSKKNYHAIQESVTDKLRRLCPVRPDGAIDVTGINFDELALKAGMKRIG